MKKDDRKLLTELARAAEAAFSNAEDLFNEAAILREAGCISRALFLHQISMEECGKVELVGGWAAGVLMGEARDFKDLRKALSSHQAKNTTNAYMLAPDEAERKAEESADWKAKMVAFNNAKREFHKRSNDAKNAALYVDIDEGSIATPKESITEQMIAEIAQQNEDYLGHMYHKTKMLLKWEKDPTEARSLSKKIKEQMEKIKAEKSDDPLKAFMLLIDEMVSTALADKSKSQRAGQQPTEPSSTKGQR